MAAPNLGNWQDDDILEYLKETIAGTYKKDGYELPSIHGVAFLAKPTEEKFLRSLSSRNNGNFVRISAPIMESSPPPYLFLQWDSPLLQSLENSENVVGPHFIRRRGEILKASLPGFF